MAPVKSAFVVLIALFAAGCGYIGDVRPPTLDVPIRIVDLRAAEFGDKIAVEFTLQPLTTEGLALKNVRAVELRVNAGTDQMIQIPPKDPSAFAFDTPAAPFVGKHVISGGARDRAKRKAFRVVEPRGDGCAGAARQTHRSGRGQFAEGRPSHLER